MSDQFEEFCDQEIRPLIEQLKERLKARGTDANFLFMIAEQIADTEHVVSFVNYSIDEQGPLAPFAELLEQGEWADDVEMTDIRDTFN